MADQWKAKSTTIAGSPVAIVDVTITRTIMVDAGIFEYLVHFNDARGEGEDLGLSEVAKFYELLQALPEESRKYFITQWSDADGKKIGLLPFAEILKKFDNRSYWRVDGTAESGFVGYYNFGGQETRIDLSENLIPQFEAKLEQTYIDAQIACDTGHLTEAEKAMIHALCDHCRSSTNECRLLYASLRELQAIRAENERKQKEKERREHESRQRENSEFYGDFPKDWGREFGNIA